VETLILFAKAPIAGHTKTRLAKERGEVDALKLATAFLYDTCDALALWQEQKLAVDPNRRVVLYAAPHVDDPVLLEAARRARCRIEPQGEGDLGVRLKQAFHAEFERGARAVAAIGADSPTVPPHLVDEAFRALAWERVALGPTFDGGYWLVGAQRPAPELFDDVPWSTPSVLATTLSRMKAQGVAVALLPFWYDVDEAADLERLVWHLRALRQKSRGAFPQTWAALQDVGIVRKESTS
jgi:uncharacterized protein